MVKDLESQLHEEKLKKVGMFTLQKKYSTGQHGSSFQIFESCHEVEKIVRPDKYYNLTNNTSKGSEQTSPQTYIHFYPIRGECRFKGWFALSPLIY